MSDDDVRLAAKLARQEGKTHPREWVRIYNSHTPYEWLLQVALSKVEPWGEDRDDERSAMHTAWLLVKDSGENGPDFDQLRTVLKRYLPIHEGDDDE